MPCLLKYLEDLTEMTEETFHMGRRVGRKERRKEKGKEIVRHVKGIANASIL